jgi:RHS repeat-associated protein
MMGFAGMELDSVTGLNLAVNRVANPGTGRWTSQGPLGFAAGDANLYRYADDNPISSADPFGLEIPPSALYPDDPRGGSNHNAALYYGSDPGGASSAGGKNFRKAGVASPHCFDIANPKDAIRQLRQHVQKYGPIHDLRIYDHTDFHGQQMMGNAPLTPWIGSLLRPLLAPGAHILLGGCEAGADLKYLQSIADATGASVTASPGLVYYYNPGQWGTYYPELPWITVYLNTK